MAERIATKTLLKLGDGGSPEMFNTVLDVLDLTPPNIGLDTEEITSHSTANFWRKYGPTLLDGGEISFEVLWDPATGGSHETVLNNVTSRTVSNFQLDFPGNTSNARWEFSGFFTSFQPMPPIDEHLKASVTIKVTDSISFTDVS